MALVAPPYGGVIVGWLNARTDSVVEVRAQRLTPSGRPAWERGGVPVCTAPGFRDRLVMADDGRDGTYLAWTDSRPEGALFATRLTRGGMRGDGWPADGALVGARSTAASGTRRLSALEIGSVGHGNAMLVWQDRWDGAAPPTRNGEILAMLLAHDGPGAASAAVYRPPARPFVAPGVGARPTLAIQARLSDGAGGTGMIRFTLAEAAPARLEIFDLAGRRLWSRDVGHLGAGDHELRLRDSDAPSAGIYFARLTQGGRAVSATAVAH